MLIRAEKLIHGLGGERARWGDMATMLKGKILIQTWQPWQLCDTRTVLHPCHVLNCSFPKSMKYENQGYMNLQCRFYILLDGVYTQLGQD